MKRRRKAALAAILLALTASCAKPLEQSQSPNNSETTPDNSVSPSIIPDAPENSEVFADFSYLPETQLSFSPVGSRISDEPINTLIPSEEYGRLIPYTGEYIYSKYSDYSIGSNYGLTTMDGKVVLDPVCTSIWIATYYGPDGQPNKQLDIYILQKVPDNISEDTRDTNLEYAVAAIDGSWATNFDFCGVYCTDQGVLCILDWESNWAIYLDENGDKILDTRDLSVYGELAPSSLYSFSMSSDGWFPLQLNNDCMILCNLDGRIIRPEDEIWTNIGYFSENLAPASNGSLYGYIDHSGNWVIEPQFTYAAPFINGIALVEDGSNHGKAIDRSGNIVFEFAGTWPYFQNINGVSYYTDYQNNSDGSYQQIYYTADFEQILVDGKSPNVNAAIFWIEKDDGILLRLPNGKELFVDDAVSVFGGICPDNYSIVTYDNDSNYNSDISVLDSEGNVILTSTSTSYAGFITDSITGVSYIYLPAAASYGTYNVYAMDGTRLLSGVTTLEATGGLFQCSDAVSTGIKNTENEWVLRVKLDTE